MAVKKEKEKSGGRAGGKGEKLGDWEYCERKGEGQGTK
jgi:hypothetical protein